MKTAKMFRVGDDNRQYSLQDMLSTNRDDDDLCEWLVQAKPGDHFSLGEGCDCVDPDEEALNDFNYVGSRWHY